MGFLEPGTSRANAGPSNRFAFIHEPNPPLLPGQLSPPLASITGIASHFSCHPGKFHSLGNPRHWRGFTALILQSRPSRNSHSPFGFSVRDSPARFARSRVCRWTKSKTESPTCAAMIATSSSSTMTSPGHLQHAAQRWHWYQIWRPLLDIGVLAEISMGNFIHWRLGRIKLRNAAKPSVLVDGIASRV